MKGGYNLNYGYIFGHINFIQDTTVSWAYILLTEPVKNQTQKAQQKERRKPKRGSKTPWRIHISKLLVLAAVLRLFRQP